MPIPETERHNQNEPDIDIESPDSALERLLRSQEHAVHAVHAALPAIAAAVMDAAVTLAQGEGRIVYLGAGTSGRIGVQDGAELSPTFGWPASRLLLLMAGGERALLQAVENAEDDRLQAEDAIARHHVGMGDVVIGLAASGGTPFTLAGLQAATASGACSVAVSNVGGGAILSACRHPILVETGPEVIAGSTRLAAGTAQKIVLNLFSTLLMIRLGHVYRGLMVDMLPRNAKLRARAVRMLETLSAAEPEAITQALDATSWRIKPALLVLHGLSAEAAEALLARHAGHLRQALAELGL